MGVIVGSGPGVDLQSLTSGLHHDRVQTLPARGRNCGGIRRHVGGLHRGSCPTTIRRRTRDSCATSASNGSDWRCARPRLLLDRRILELGRVKTCVDWWSLGIAPARSLLGSPSMAPRRLRVACGAWALGASLAQGVTRRIRLAKKPLETAAAQPSGVIVRSMVPLVDIREFDSHQ